MPILALLVPAIMAAHAAASDSSRVLEAKYNAAGSVLRGHAEHAMELEYGHHRLFRPYLRVPIIHRDYDHESWGKSTGKGRERGFSIQAGAKARPLPFHYIRRFEVGLYYRYMRLDSRHRDIDESSYSEVQDIESQSLGYAFSWNIPILRFVTLEPFIQSDHGRYWIKERRPVLPGTFRWSEYTHRIDDETRAGLNIGIQL